MELSDEVRKILEEFGGDVPDADWEPVMLKLAQALVYARHDVAFWEAGWSNENVARHEREERISRVLRMMEGDWRAEGYRSVLERKTL